MTWSICRGAGHSRDQRTPDSAIECTCRPDVSRQSGLTAPVGHNIALLYRALQRRHTGPLPRRKSVNGLWIAPNAGSHSGPAWPWTLPGWGSPPTLHPSGRPTDRVRPCARLRPGSPESSGRPVRMRSVANGSPYGLPAKLGRPETPIESTKTSEPVLWQISRDFLTTGGQTSGGMPGSTAPHWPVFKATR